MTTPPTAPARSAERTGRPTIELPRRLSDVMSAADGEGFAGVVRVDLEGDVIFETAHGFADRAHRIVNTIDTRIGIASGAKGFTALVIMALVERGVLSLETTARSLLGDDLSLIDPAVTIGQLVSHRSGIGDYLDEDSITSITDYAMDVPVHQLSSPQDFLPLLDGRPMTARPGEQFKYNNGGFVLLALLAERATDESFYDLVDTLVCRPAGLAHTAFLRTDELPGDAAIGYLHGDGLRSNVLHVPVRCGGDGGVYTTAADVSLFWQALLDGRIVGSHSVDLITRPYGGTPCDTPYGLGFWLDPATDTVSLEGYDAGASFRSEHQPSRNVTWTVMSNWSDGAWSVADKLAEILSTRGRASAEGAPLT